MTLVELRMQGMFPHGQVVLQVIDLGGVKNGSCFEDLAHNSFLLIFEQAPRNHGFVRELHIFGDHTGSVRGDGILPRPGA